MLNTALLYLHYLDANIHHEYFEYIKSGVPDVLWR